VKSSSIHAVAVAAVLLGASTVASAQFSGPYDPSKWQLTHDAGSGGSDAGYVDIGGAPTSITLFGSDDSLGGSGHTSVLYSITMPASGTVAFSWSYATTDSSGEPQWDPAGYLVNASRFQLSDDSGTPIQASASPVNVPVNKGDKFSFFVDSVDNFAGNASLRVEGFSAPVPEPASIAMLAAGLGVIGGVVVRRRRSV
jgi:hypothetical protein